jgi:cyclopropane-fatty-acyl-phospholipid synthase
MPQARRPRAASAILGLALLHASCAPESWAQFVLPAGGAAARAGEAAGAIGAETAAGSIVGSIARIPSMPAAPSGLFGAQISAAALPALPVASIPIASIRGAAALPTAQLAAPSLKSPPLAGKDEIASPPVSDQPAAAQPALENAPAGVAAAVHGSTRSPKERAASAYERTVAEVFAAAGVQIHGDQPHDLTVSNPAFYRRLLSDPRLELGETYMDGQWDSPSVDQLAAKLMSARREGGLLRRAAPLWRAPVPAALAVVRHSYRYLRDLLTNRQTRTRSRTVAEEHYDAGNELYRQMLDPTLTYTSGVWAPGYTLEDAQNAKYDLIARKLGLKPGQSVLDIGSGFGGFARFAAKNYGAKVTGITISVEQLKAARALSAGVDGANFLYSDYRDIPHRFPKDAFDHAVSIEMIEAVGAKNLSDYFASVHSVLKDGGRFVIQAIASNHDVVNSNPWFSKYIFHDGVAPSTAQVDRAARGAFGPAVDRHRITGDYDTTLLAWHANFTRAWPALKAEYGERFKRMWDFYLLSVAGGFRARELQLDQAVYVKGGRSEDVAPIRELPTRERLDSMRAAPQELDLIARTIARLEDEKLAVAAAAAPRPARARTPLAKDSRIAVIGAGPSGLSSALELRRLGYTNVVVFEKESEAGGKSHTVDLAGRPHDLGATMGVRGKYDEIARLAEEQGQATVPFPKQVHYDLQRGSPVGKAPLGQFVKLMGQGLRYLIHHARMAGGGERGLEVPPAELSDPWPVVMRRLGLDLFADRMTTYLTGYGYGGPETPAVFGERMLDASAIRGAATAQPIMWQNGTQPIWKGVARGLDVRTNAAVERIERGADGVSLFLEGGAAPERFDKIILAVDPQAALRVLDATAEERALFSRVRYMPYATFAARVEGFSEGKAEVGYLKENMTLERAGRPMAWIKRYADDDVFVFHLFAPAEVSDERITANIAEDMRRLGAGKVTLVDSRRWPFFPHVDSETMREERFYERARNLQGLNRTVFVNEALGMSTMPDAAKQGKKAAQRLASGEY